MKQFTIQNIDKTRDTIRQSNKPTTKDTQLGNHLCAYWRNKTEIDNNKDTIACLAAETTPLERHNQLQSLDQICHLCQTNAKYFSTRKTSFWKMILFLASHIDQITLKKHTHHFFLRLLLKFTSVHNSKANLGPIGITQSIFHLLRQEHHNFHE